MSKANELGVLIVLIVGSKEMEKKEVSIKNMRTEQQETIKISSLIDKIYDIIDESASYT